MNKIVVNLGNFKLDEITLGRGTLSIGRATDNDISLADSATSGHHAKIVTIFTSSFIQDLNSTNGTIVNGRKIVRHTLSHGDIISIGNLQLLFKSDASASPVKTSKTIQISKDEIKSALGQVVKKPSQVSKKNYEVKTPVTQIIKKNDKLSGFSISIPSAEELVEKTVKRVVSAAPAASSAIPILDETLPLGELRRNPDRMVILTQHNDEFSGHSTEQEIEDVSLATALSSKDEVLPDDAIISINPNQDSDTILNDNQIRQILMENETLEKHSREYAIYAVAITVVLVIIAFTYILI